MDASYLRPEILAFAIEMEKKLRKHDKDKGDSYKNATPAGLLQHVRAETEELHDAVRIYLRERIGVQSNAIDVLQEAADVGNMAMMVAWVVCNNANVWPQEQVESLYYVQDSRSYVGNDMLWWRVGGMGYTTNLNEAGQFTAEQALDMQHSRKKDIPWPVPYINSKARSAVDMQYVNKKESNEYVK